MYDHTDYPILQTTPKICGYANKVRLQDANYYCRK